ncbi:ribosome biogenesis GTPase [Desulfonispora thiosulfatigenes DSM 11270]|uniref:Small ribosomal subunit biogenesis GTPase RsgA n=1 Tax=Desulfonispora thiosulfatigenes DSM 11270 TaxID=656914 RepID=A0A1W1UF63_DESTI|nr:ribosome small subunit-dependent GTPase A [Desulfonispora thiosulfatigenes]SMB79738.1 ribosome biogenesis GTPase [Desulfonispora thiosulfatigenes DSM 11270]
MNNRLINLGFSDRFIQQANLYNGLILGRVISQYKDLYKVATEKCELLAEVSGRFRHEVISRSQFPVVGDFVMIDRDNNKNGNAIIHQVLDRKSAFSRKAAGNENDVQFVAANIDMVFICMSLNKDFNLRRLERYIAITWDSGAVPVVVLTKSDLCGSLSKKLEEVNTVTVGVDVVVTTSMTEDGYETVLKYIKSGITVAFIGSSGVGKSTLINRLIGKDVIETGDIRDDDKGRHTTTRRDLIIISSGGAVIDTPGMREIGIESANISKTFTDIEELADKCKYSNCTHKNEPRCAVKQAIEEGIISEERFLSYEKLKKEAKYEGLNSRQIEKQKINEMFSGFGGIKNARNYIKSKNMKK